MKNILLLLVCLVSGFYLSAQENQNVDNTIFTDVVFVKPNPPKSIKGWELAISEDNSAEIIGEYPGKIIKFQFKGDAVGIEIRTTQESGIIEYSVDASEWEMLDLYKNVAENESLYFTIGENLKNRRHTLQIRMTGEKNKESAGNKCIIRKFYYNAPE